MTNVLNFKCYSENSNLKSEIEILNRRLNNQALGNHNTDTILRRKHTQYSSTSSDLSLLNNPKFNTKSSKYRLTLGSNNRSIGNNSSSHNNDVISIDDDNNDNDRHQHSQSTSSSNLS